MNSNSINKSIKFGAVFPTTQISQDSVAVRDWTQAAEGLGFDRIVLYDHPVCAQKLGREDLIGHQHYTNEHMFGEPLALLAYMAAITSRITLETGVLILAQRQTALVAKQAAQIAVLSNGRLILGVGAGANPVEFEALNVDYASRFKIFDEQIGLMRQLWSEALVDFTGKFHRVDRVSQFPHPPGDNIPIWIGGITPSAINRAARYGHGFIFGPPAPVSIPLANTMHDALRAVGRDPVGFPMECFIDNGWGPDHLRQEVENWAAIGGTHVSLRTTDENAPYFNFPPSGFTTPRQHIDALRDFANEMF